MGCTTYTHERLLHEGKIASSIVDSGEFKHKVFKAEPSYAESSGNRLHIYLGGDGQPWRTPKRVAKDPTSKRAIMLKSMLRDNADSVLIGRPCYFQVADTRCLGNWWTHDRYHLDVVNSLLKVVEELATNHQELWLIGYSGGGALAVLIGNRLDRPVNVMTINANLDHQAWSRHHQYSPLSGSLNPTGDSAHNADMRELHWYAEDDQNVLPEWIQAYSKAKHAQCVPTTGNHSDDWPQLWPVILERSEELMSQAGL